MTIFKTGDKIIIPDGFTLVYFKGDYSKTYTVDNCYFDERHGVEFTEFYDGEIKYSYPSVAFDLLREEI